MKSTVTVHEDKVCIKTEKTEITHTKEAISVSAPKINLESGIQYQKSLPEVDLSKQKCHQRVVSFSK